MQSGDRIVVWKYACMPFVLRKTEQEDVYKMLGPAYVQGRMKCQIPELVDKDKFEWEMV